MKKLISALLTTLIALSAIFVLAPRIKAWASDGLGEGLSFDGTSYVSVSPIDANVYTIELWFNSTINNALMGSNRFLIQTSDDSLTVWHNVYNASVTWHPLSIGTGNWHHLAVIIDYTTWQITPFLDGANLTAKPMTTHIKPSLSFINIGCYWGNRFFNGVIDEVRIYNRTLSQEEVLAHYNSGTGQYGRPEPGLAAGWHFDEGNGTTAYDYSENDNKGTIHGASWSAGHVPLPDIAITAAAPSAAIVVSGDTVNINVTAENLGTPYENFPVTAYYDDIPIGTMPVTNLAPGASINLTFSWNTTGVPLGNYTIRANATAVQGEVNVTNNEIIDGTIWIVASPVASFTYSPIPAMENFNTTFDASSSNATSGSITSYGWDFGDGSSASTTDPVMTHIYTLHGTYNITLTVKNSANLTNTTWMLVDVQRHDVAILDVTPYRNWVYEGLPLNINVTIVNIGDSAETATVDLYYNITSGGKIGTETVSLSISQNETLTLTWNTFGIQPGLNYTITANATILFDSNMTNNILDGTTKVKVRIRGDINDDDKVDMADISLAAKAFGSNPTHLRWNQYADINQDGKIDLKDISLVARNFGKQV
jgi:PKD repeat protein